MAQSFEDLEVWKRSCQLAVSVIEHFRDSRDFALKDQISRSAISIPSNIAEGQERKSYADFARFLRYSSGSAAELRTQLYLSQRLGSLAPETSKQMIEETKQISKMLQGLIKSIKPNDTQSKAL